MQSTLLQSPVMSESIDGSANVFMHVWPVHNNDDKRREVSWEVELLASHTRSSNHLDLSCPACRRLRLRLQSIATTVVEQLATTLTSSLRFDIYSHFASIIWSPSAGPCVSTSIYLHDATGADSTVNGPSGAVSRIKELLKSLGVREH